MARRRRSRSVRGRPNYVWLTVTDINECDTNNVLHGLQVPLLLPEDWNTLNAMNDTGCQLVHLVYHHIAVGVSVPANYAWNSLYGIFKASDMSQQLASVPNMQDSLGFLNTFDQFDECLHWGSYTCMPYSIAQNADVFAAGGSVAGLAENVVNLNVKRNLKGDDSIIALYGVPLAIGQEIWQVTSYCRCLVRLGLK